MLVQCLQIIVSFISEVLNKLELNRTWTLYRLANACCLYKKWRTSGAPICNRWTTIPFGNRTVIQYVSFHDR